MTRRVYTETANSYAPFRQAQLQGLGLSSGPERKIGPSGWPVGRSYVGIAHFRAPYDEFSYFQDNSLQGLGACPVMNSSYVQVKGLGRALGALTSSEIPQIDQNAPGAVKRFLLSGDPVSPLRGDVTLPFNQVHPYVYGALAVVAAATSYVSYKRWKKQNPHHGI